MFNVKCGISRRQATRRASARSSIVQHPPYVVSAALRLSYICIDSPTTSWPCDFRRYAAVEESTPPDMATAIFIGSETAQRRTVDLRHNSPAVEVSARTFCVLVV